MTSVRDFGARGDGKTDDTQSITHAIQKGDGTLHFPRGDYLISRSLQIPLQTHGRLSIDGANGAACVVTEVQVLAGHNTVVSRTNVE
jgi:polygalacturonase